MHLGLISLRGRRMDAARDYFARLISLGGENADVEYNLACVESLSGHPGESLRHLESAFRLGFRDGESIAKDPDLSNVRTQPDFKRIVGSYLGEKGE